MTLEGLNTIVTNLTNHIVWKAIPDLDSRVDERSVSGGG